MKDLKVLAPLLLLGSVCGEVSIEKFGAVSGDKSRALENSKAIAVGVAAAAMNEEVLYVPEGKVFYTFGTQVSGVNNLSFRIDGTLEGVPDFDNWNKEDGGGKYVPVVGFTSSNNITITGNGTINGRGYPWWWAEILQILSAERPKLLNVQNCSHVLIEGIHLKDSPYWTLNLDDVSHVVVRHIEVHTDVDAQLELMKRHNRTKHVKELLNIPEFDWKKWLEEVLVELHIPTFPLNTDGIDVKGIHIHIHDVKIINYDDIIVPKPCDIECQQTNCTEHILIENVQARGVGFAVGSVGPSAHHNCVNNVTFRNISLDYPMKGIYVKTDPGDSGSGTISNITFEDFDINTPIWWPIWIGPQQQHQPGWNWTQHQECALTFPLFGSDKHCMAQRRVVMEDITLKDIRIKNPLLSPGVIRCNETRYDDPTNKHHSCTRIRFDGVKISGKSTNFPYGRNYGCWNAEDSTAVDADPVPSCFSKSEVTID